MHSQGLAVTVAVVVVRFFSVCFAHMFMLYAIWAMMLNSTNRGLFSLVSSKREGVLGEFERVMPRRSKILVKTDPAGC